MWTPSTGAFRNHPQSGIFQYGSVWTWRIYPPNGSIKSGGYRIGRHTHNIRSYWRVFSWRVEAKLEIRSCGENNVMSHKPPMTGHGLYYTSYMTYIYIYDDWGMVNMTWFFHKNYLALRRATTGFFLRHQRMVYMIAFLISHNWSRSSGLLGIPTEFPSGTSWS